MSKIGKMRTRIIVEKQDESTRDSVGGFQDLWIPALDGEQDILESGTTATNITIANHGLESGDYIVNTTRGNALREVAVVDVDNVSVSAVTNQTDGDTVKLHRYSKSKLWGGFENKVSPYIDENQQRKLIVKNKITIRFRDDIEESFRFRVGDRTFELLSYFDIDERNYFMTADCRELK